MSDHEKPQSIPQANSASEEFEEITSEEVDRVVDALEVLMGQTQSENIRALLEEAADAIFDLVYADDVEFIDGGAESLGEAA